MVETKTRFFPKAQGRHTRLCFTRDKVTLNQKTPSKDEKGNIIDENAIELYPNYQIRQGEVQMSTRLPNNYQVPPESLQNISLKLTFTSSCSFQQGDVSDQIVASTSRSVVQIHFFSFKNQTPIYLSATGTLIENSNEYMILTCLHVLKHSIDPSEYLILVTAEEDNNHHDFQSLIDKYNTYLLEQAKIAMSKKSKIHSKRKQEKTLKSKKDQSQPREEEKKSQDEAPKKINRQDFLQYLQEKQNKLSLFKFYEANIDWEFLSFRKKWLERIKTERDDIKIIEPISGMKPSPALDVSILTLDQKSVKKLKNKKIFMKISSQHIHEVDTENDKNLFLLGFNETQAMVDFTEPEYKETLQVENVGSRRSRVKKKIEVPLLNFLNTGLSVSCGKYVKMERGFLLYKGSSSDGSSGGPVLNNQGKFLGISVGNFEDEERPGGGRGSSDLVKFDIPAPSEKIQKGSRNYNIAIAINHPGLQNYLEEREKKLPLTRSQDKFKQEFVEEEDEEEIKKKALEKEKQVPKTRRRRRGRGRKQESEESEESEEETLAGKRSPLKSTLQNKNQEAQKKQKESPKKKSQENSKTQSISEDAKIDFLTRLRAAGESTRKRERVAVVIDDKDDEKDVEGLEKSKKILKK